jgi:hypothetical protein
MFKFNPEVTSFGVGFHIIKIVLGYNKNNSIFVKKNKIMIRYMIY